MLPSPPIPDPALSPRQGAFIDSVLSLRPGIAVFDCDGTLWDADSGEGFFYWEMERGLIPADTAAWARRRYDDYRNGDVSEETMCGEMVTIHGSLRQQLIMDAAREYFDQQVAPKIFPEMRELTSRLAAAGCELWVVSSTNQWVVEAGVAGFGIARERVLAACVAVREGLASNELVRVPSGEAKAEALRERLSRAPDAAFGNSVHDAAMLAMAQAAFAVNPNPDLEDLATRNRWTIYKPGG
jgi:phosphoserine phosphatase